MREPCRRFSSAAEMRDAMMSDSLFFEDVLRANDRGVQELVKQVTHMTLICALKTATPQLRDKFMRNLSKRAREVLQEDSDYWGPVRLSEVEKAQQAVVEAMHMLIDMGELVLRPRNLEGLE